MKVNTNRIADIDGKGRSENIKLNIYLSFIIKIVSIGLSYLVIPMTINYLNSEQYGIWMTLLSILSWMSFMDIGLGNGLRNKLTESLSKNDLKSAREYISTAYAAISSIVILIFAVLVIIIPSLNWNKIFNTQTISNSDFVEIVIIVLCFFLFNFVLSLCNQLFYAVQESALTGLASLLLNLFLVVSILILKKVSSGSLIYLGASYGISMISSSIILTAYFFTKHKELVPNINLIRRSKVRDILEIGIKFFIIQISAVVIFTTDNMIITQVLGPKEVTSYNIVQKLFSVITIGHTIIVTPLWSACTDAYHKNDINWIKSTLRKLNILMIPIIVATTILVTMSSVILRYWIGDKGLFPNFLIVLMAIYTVISIWNNNFGYILGGMSKVRLGSITCTFTALVNIPLSVILAKYFHSSAGVILGTIICISVSSIISPIQVWYFIYNKNHSNFLNKLLS